MKIKTILSLASLLPATTWAAASDSLAIIKAEGEYTAEWQWDCNKQTNLVNLLRLDASIAPWRGGSIDIATLHTVKANETIIADWQTFSNIEDENIFAAIAILGYTHTWDKGCHLFVGARNMNEDFFTSPCTSLFTSSSPGIFPTISASYPIANYPVSSMSVYFDIEMGAWTLKHSLYNGIGYRGWNGKNNPFILRPGRDGLLNVTELTYTASGFYSAGRALHTKQASPEGEVVSGNVSEAGWINGEQPLWQGQTLCGETSVALMAQYSENTRHSNACHRYAERGLVAEWEDDSFGVSAQRADFLEGIEYSLELTWHHALNDNLALQPAFQWINNADGHYTTLSLRLICGF